MSTPVIPSVPVWLFNTTVVISRRPEGTSDGQGGETSDDYQPVTSAGVVARASSPSGSDFRIAEQLKAIVDQVFYFQPGQDIRMDDQITWNGRTFFVTVPKLIPSEPVYHKVFAKEYQGA